MTYAAAAPGHEIVVPGSTSNLGPGFDALSVAVDVALRVRIAELGQAPAPDPGAALTLEGQVPASGENRIATAFAAACAAFGDRPPLVRATVATDIPMRAGLGSSAAATIAGLRLYELLTRRRDPGALLEIATRIEGHPDNAAAALLGGITLSCQQDDGRILALSWTWPSDLAFVIGTPDTELETAFARQVLAPEISRADAVFNLQRALLLVRALESGRYDLLREALRDRWHQPARSRYVPGLADALAVQHESVLGAYLSGAGPSLALVAAPGRHEEAADQLRQVYDRLNLSATVRILAARPPVTQ
jgi:homoserine kinase